MKKKLGILAAGIGALIIITGSIGGIFYFSSRVSYNEELEAPISSRATIRRDAAGYAALTAGSMEDALFALGYLHATDMLPMMEYWRSISAGDTSRFLGREGIPLDRLAKIIGFTRKGTVAYERLKEPFISYLNSYARGINFRKDTANMLKTGTSREWKPQDTLAIYVMLEWTNSFLNNRELFFQFPAKKIPLLKKNTLPDNLVWSYSEGEEPAVTIVKEIKTLIEKYIGPFNRGTAFYISPVNIKSGSSAMGYSIHNSLNVYPGWFPVVIDCPDLKIRGITHAGLPFFFAGSSEGIDFATLNADIDSQEFILEPVKKINDEILYQSATGWKKFIPVKNPETSEGREKISIIWESENGPVLNDIFSNEEYSNHVVTVRSVFPDESAVEGLFRAASLKTLPDRLNAVRNINSSPRFYVFANDQEFIKIYTGKYLRNREAKKIFIQAPGVKKADVLHLSAINNRRFFISTVTGSSFSDDLTPDIAQYCVSDMSIKQRFNELTSVNTQLSEKNIKTILSDSKCVHAEKFTPIMLTMLSSNPVTSSKLTRSYLHAWNGQIRADDPTPTIFHTLLQRYIHNIFSDEFPETIADIDKNYRYILPQFYEMIRSGQDLYFNDISTETFETRETIFDRAFFQSMRYLSRKMGPEIDKWNWNKIHIGQFKIPWADNTFSTGLAGDIPNRGYNHSLSSFAFSEIGYDLTPLTISSINVYKTKKFSGIRMQYSYSVNPLSKFYYGRTPQTEIQNIETVNGVYLTVISPVKTTRETPKDESSK